MKPTSNELLDIIELIIPQEDSDIFQLIIPRKDPKNVYNFIGHEINPELIETVTVDFGLFDTELKFMEEDNIDMLNSSSVIATDETVSNNIHFYDDVSNIFVGSNNRRKLRKSRSAQRATTRTTFDLPPRRCQSAVLESWEVGKEKPTHRKRRRVITSNNNNYESVDARIKKSKLYKVVRTGAMNSLKFTIRRCKGKKDGLRAIKRFQRPKPRAHFRLQQKRRSKPKRNGYKLMKSYEKLQKALVKQRRIRNLREKKKVKERERMMKRLDKENCKIKTNKTTSNPEEDKENFMLNIQLVQKQAMQRARYVDVSSAHSHLLPIKSCRTKSTRARSVTIRDRVYGKATVETSPQVDQGITLKSAEYTGKSATENAHNIKESYRGKRKLKNLPGLSNLNKNVVKTSPPNLTNVLGNSKEINKNPTKVTYLECAQELSIYILFHIKTCCTIDREMLNFKSLGVNMTTLYRGLTPLFGAPDNVFECTYQAFRNFFATNWIPSFEFKLLYKHMIDYIDKNYTPKINWQQIFRILFRICREMHQRDPTKFTKNFLSGAQEMYYTLYLQEGQTPAKDSCGQNKEMPSTISTNTNTATTLPPSTSSIVVQTASAIREDPEIPTATAENLMTEKQRADFLAQCNIYRTLTSQRMAESQYLNPPRFHAPTYEPPPAYYNQQTPTYSNFYVQPGPLQQIPAVAYPILHNLWTQSIAIANNTAPPRNAASIVVTQTPSMTPRTSAGLCMSDTSSAEEIDTWFEKRVRVDQNSDIEQWVDYHFMDGGVGTFITGT